MAVMNVGDSTRPFADEGKHERRTRNRVVTSDKDRRVVKLEEIFEGRHTYNGVWRAENALHG